MYFLWSDFRTTHALDPMQTIQMERAILQQNALREVAHLPAHVQEAMECVVHVRYLSEIFVLIPQNFLWRFIAYGALGETL